MSEYSPVLLISDGNSKLNKTAKILKAMTGKRTKIVSFNLPAYKSRTGKKTCVGAKDCASVCYARQGTYNFSSSVRVREDNLARLMQIYNESGENGVAQALSEIVKASKATHIRVHDSGDFFAAWYVRAWMKVAENNPDKVFYAYTKSVPLFLKISVPANFVLTYSYGGVWDNQIPADAPVARIFVSHEDLQAAGFVDGNSEEMADAYAIIGEKRIGLVYHGVKKMNAEEINKFAIDNAVKAA